MTKLLLGTACAAALLTLAPSAARADATPNYHLVQTIKLGGTGGWDYLKADSAGKRVYISRGTHVMVLDTQTGKLAGDIQNTPGVHGIALDEKRGKGYISDGGDDSVTVFDIKTLKETAKIKVGGRPDAIIFDPGANRVFTFNAGSSDTTAIDTATGKVAGTIALGGKPEFAVSDGQGKMYVNIEDKNEIVQFDSKTLTVLNHWPLVTGEGPSGLAFDVKHKRLFATCDAGKMPVLDADTGKLITTLTIGDGPDAAAFDAKTDLVFASNGAGTLSVIHEDAPDKFTPVGTVTTQPGARTMTLDSKSHKVFVVSATPAPAASGETGRRRGYVPDSFVVLVFAP